MILDTLNTKEFHINPHIICYSFHKNHFHSESPSKHKDAWEIFVTEVDYGYLELSSRPTVRVGL